MNPGRTVSNIGIYNLREMEIRWLAGRKNRLEDMVAAALANVRKAIDAIRRAEFPPRPGDRRSCEKCAYGFLCPSELPDPRDHPVAEPVKPLPT